MDLQLSGKVAIVTGASKGIGRAIAEFLAGQGMAVVAAARSTELLQSLADDAREHRRTVFSHTADLSRADTPGPLVDAALQEFGRIDLIVNNAGATKRGDFLTLTEADWHDGYALKFFAAVRITRAAWPALVKSRGCVVNIAGVGGRTGNAEFTIGGSVNAAMLNLTKSLADRAVHEGVRVNAINPGSIVTDRLTKRIETLAKDQAVTMEEAQRRMTRQQNIARFGDCDEIAAAVAFLASHHGGYINGAIIDIDGGMTRTL